MRRALLVLLLAALAAAAPAAAFVPADPLAPKQWYLQADRAFDAWPEPPTTLQPVKVAVVDSGVDCSLPDFQGGRILDARSFVGGDPCIDSEGHGTFVAGEIAADLDTQGIVGIAYTAQLLVAKVVRADGTIPLKAEAAAIRWAADSGARVINLSLGGVRDPVHPSRDTYSPLEAAAVAYAYSKGAVLVAAVGNGDEAVTQPWPYASYPAALPHVIGVSALTRSGNVPEYSNRDPVFNDIAAPGSGIFSTFPLALTAQRPLCTPQGYSECGTEDYRDPEGTSFAAPQVTAAAAVLFALNPLLTASQVTALLEHNAVDVSSSTGCARCAVLHDPLSGFGRLDVARAVAALTAGQVPPPDRFETNDDAGSQAHTMWGKRIRIAATLDYYEDPVDVYRIVLGPHERLTGTVTGDWPGARVRLTLWKPPTKRVDVVGSRTLRAAQSAGHGATQRLSFTAPGRGWYFVEVRASKPGYGPYTLMLSKAQASSQPRA